VLAFGAGLVLGVGAKADRDRLEDAPCAATRQCPSSQVESIRTRYLIADITMGVGIVAIGVATVLWLTGKTPAPTAASTRLDLRF
jgi:hypothetical protein